ncbi:MAG: hypothetical protein ACXADY_24010 [Candidatus Hodarchaeales archaeon]
MPKLQEVYKKNQPDHPSYFIYIPTAIVKFKGWKKGDRLEFKEDNGKVLIEKAE